MLSSGTMDWDSWGDDELALKQEKIAHFETQIALGKEQQKTRALQEQVQTLEAEVKLLRSSDAIHLRDQKHQKELKAVNLKYYQLRASQRSTLQAMETKCNEYETKLAEETKLHQEKLDHSAQIIQALRKANLSPEAASSTVENKETKAIGHDNTLDDPAKIIELIQSISFCDKEQFLAYCDYFQKGSLEKNRELEAHLQNLRDRKKGRTYDLERCRVNFHNILLDRLAKLQPSKKLQILIEISNIFLSYKKGKKDKDQNYSHPGVDKVSSQISSQSGWEELTDLIAEYPSLDSNKRGRMRNKIIILFINNSIGSLLELTEERASKRQKTSHDQAQSSSSSSEPSQEQASSSSSSDTSQEQSLLPETFASQNNNSSSFSLSTNYTAGLFSFTAPQPEAPAASSPQISHKRKWGLAGAP